MWQTVVIWIIVALCAFFVGRRFLRQWRSALAGKSISCGVDSGCGCCSTSSSCTSDKKNSTEGS